MEAKAINPNDASLSLFLDSNDDTPTPKAIKKGTVIGPVVTPPLSKAKAKIDSFPLNITIITIANKTI